MRFSPFDNGRGLRVLAAVALCILVTGLGAQAQGIVVEPPGRIVLPPLPPPPTNFGPALGAGLNGALGELPKAPDLKPDTGATGAPPPLSIVRFHCEVAPEANACRDAPAPDGGGSDEACDCNVDPCHDDGAGFRVCEKH